jgi:hypothetical protein
LAPAFAHGVDELGIRMTDKILKRRLFSVFFAHENQRDKGRQQYRSGGQFELFE